MSEQSNMCSGKIRRKAPALSKQPGARRDLRRRPLMPYRITDLPDRISSKIAPDDSGCWLWASPTRTGYGRIRWEGQYLQAHRAVYRILVGPISKATLDHLCRVRRCVNPDHLEPVSIRENLLRGKTLARANLDKTHCLRGHLFDEENTYRPPSRPHERHCRACIRLRAAKRSQPT